MFENGHCGGLGAGGDELFKVGGADEVEFLLGFEEFGEINREIFAGGCSFALDFRAVDGDADVWHIVAEAIRFGYPGDRGGKCTDV